MTPNERLERDIRQKVTTIVMVLERETVEPDRLTPRELRAIVPEVYTVAEQIERYLLNQRVVAR